MRINVKSKHTLRFVLKQILNAIVIYNEPRKGLLDSTFSTFLLKNSCLVEIHLQNYKDIGKFAFTDKNVFF